VIPDRATAYGERVRRLANIRRHPRVSLHFDSNGGRDIVVLVGTAEILDDYPAVSGNAAWLEKYGETIDARFGSAAKFAERFSVPVRIRLTRVRGF
jgi:PPOX class probable F420-dependent enzyme